MRHDSVFRMVILAVALGILPAAARGPGDHRWTRIGEGGIRARQGATLVWAGDLQKILRVGDGVEALDPASGTWSEFSPAKPPVKDPIQPFYQTAYDAQSKRVYCLSLGPQLYEFDLEKKGWTIHPPEPLLEGLSWHMLASDGQGHVVAVGSDKRIENLGWTRTVVLDTATGRWSPLPLPPPPVVQKHREWVEATETLIDLVGRIRLAWYRDPLGVGTDEELQALGRRCNALCPLSVMGPFKPDLDRIGDLLRGRTPLEALRSARALQPKLEDAAFAQYPVPHSRRNAPLVYDQKDRCFVLFGGDHEDYQVNDTWTLDLEKKAWKRMAPALAPSPRAGHAACYLPKSGRVAIYEGYAASTSGDYGASPWQVLDPRELWVYDAAVDRWELAGTVGGKGEDGAAPPIIGKFFGYSATWYEVPALAADSKDRIVLAAPAGKSTPASTWGLTFDPRQTDSAARETLGQTPNGRRRRALYFRADFSEVSDDPKVRDLAALPANQWVKLTPAPRTPARGCRQRDWSTAVWDSDREQILMWGGGHCVRSSSVPLHYSPVSNRIVEGYDAEEPYCYNGWCGPASSLLNKQWIDTHAYHLYAYDPKCKLLVTARGFLYDPERMDWVRIEPFKSPFRYSWGSIVIASSAHGAVAWGVAGETPGLWLFDRDRGWTPLEPKGKLFTPWCDSHGMVYDSKRDRMLLSSVGGTYGKKSDGSFLQFEFRSRSLDLVTPRNHELNQTGCARELAYVAHADWVLVGDLLQQGDPKTGRTLTRVYDCAKNQMFLLDAGPVGAGYSAGWMYDSKRQLVYSFGFNGEAWALRIDPATAKLMEKPD